MLAGRILPNILVTGTPGVGKSSLCAELSIECGLEWICIASFVEEHQLYLDYDEEYQCHELDEDGLIDELEDKIKQGGIIIDYHGCDFFPSSWFDIIFVLRTNNTLLYDRLKARGYDNRKLQENVECEIFQMLLEEARESFPQEKVHELQSNSEEDLGNNVQWITQWVQNWKQ